MPVREIVWEVIYLFRYGRHYYGYHPYSHKDKAHTCYDFMCVEISPAWIETYKTIEIWTHYIPLTTKITTVTPARTARFELNTLFQSLDTLRTSLTIHLCEHNKQIWIDKTKELREHIGCGEHIN